MKKTLFTIFLIIILSITGFSQSRYRMRDRSLSLEKRLKADLNNALIKAGPFYILGSINISDIGYNDNINNTHEEGASDITARIGPRLTTITPFGRSFYLYLRGSYNYQIFYDYDDLNKSNYSLGGDIVALFNFIGITAGYNTQGTTDFLDTEVDSRVYTETQAYNIDTELRLSSKYSINLGYNLSERYYPDDPDRDERLSRDTSRYTIGFNHKLLPNTGYSLSYSEIHYDFALNPDYDTIRNDYTLTINWERRARYYIDLSLTYTDLQPQNTQGRDYQGFMPDILLSFPLFYRLNISLSHERSISFSQSIDNFYFRNQKSGIETDIALTRGMSLILSYFFAQNTYDFPSIIDDEEIYRQDDIYSYGAGVRFRLIDALSMRININRESKRSNIITNNYDTIRVFLSTSYAF